MQRKSSKANANFCDSPTSYGWTSIVLHWLGAVAIILLWFIGRSIGSADPDDVVNTRGLHVSAGMTVWLLLVYRTVRRFRNPHPHVAGLGHGMFRIARGAHYLMLVLLAAMLMSGPLLLWSAALPVTLFGSIDWAGSGTVHPAVLTVASAVHRTSASALAILVILHVAGALKHLMFHDDDTFVAMVRPNRR